jgi:suppressor of fused
MIENRLDMACYEIDSALAHLYGQDAIVFQSGGLQLLSERARFGDPGFDWSATKPLDCIKAYESRGDYPHWHYVTMGFSNLYSSRDMYGKLENCAEGLSGYGFELTLRLRKNEESTPPSWPMTVLQNMAEYVFATGNGFEPNEQFPLNGPIVRGAEGVTIEVCAFTPDKELGLTESESGKIQFLQLVGLTTDEYLQMKKWDVPKFLDLLAINNPLFIMNPYRQSICENPEIGKMIERGILEDGSSAGAAFVSVLEVDQIDDLFKVTVDAMGVEEIVNAMQGRIPLDRFFKLYGPAETKVIFQPAETSKIIWQDKLLVIELTKQGAKEILDKLSVTRGRYSFSGISNLELSVVPTKIKVKGKNTIRVLGW